MKSWAIAIGLSVGLHLGFVMVLGREAIAAPVHVRVVEEKTEMNSEVVSFTPVSVLPRAEPSSPAAPPVAAARPKARGAPQAVSAVSKPAGGAPHPDPLPVGEGDTSSDVEINAAPLAEAGVANDTASAGNSFVTEAVLVGPSPEVIALVHARLAAAAEGCYPPVARRYQQRGTVQLSFCTDAHGGAASSAVTISSGAEVLDAAARGCVVERASPFPAVAASRCFSVPVRFGAR